MDTESTPREVGLSEGLGPLSPMEQLLAFCDWERKHNPHPQGKLHVAAWAAAEIERLTNERAVLARWMADALSALCDVDADAEDGGESLRMLKDRGDRLVRAVLAGGPNVNSAAGPAA